MYTLDCIDRLLHAAKWLMFSSTMNLKIKSNLLGFETLKPGLPFPVVISLQSNDIISGEEEGKKLLLCIFIY